MKKDMPAIIVLGAGILLSVLMCILVRRLEVKDLRNEFNFDAENYSVALEKSIGENLNSLHAIEGLYASSPQVTRARFHTFINNILPHSSGIHALRWIPRVAGAERKKYEAAAIKDGYSTYRFAELNPQKQLVTAGKRDEYFPVYYSESAGGTEPALGLDMSAHAAGRAFLEKARDTGAMVATRRITLNLESDHQFAFLALQPIYRNASPHDTLKERRKNLIGYAVGVFRFGDMVSAALKGINLKGIELSLFDESATPERRMLYSNVRQENSVSEYITSTKALNVADRRWTIKFHSTPEYISTHKSLYSWVVLAAGLMFTFLLALYVLKMKRHAFAMERSKDTMSAVLNSIDAAIAIIDSKDMRISAYNKVFIQESEVRENEIIGGRCCDVAQKSPFLCNRLCEECPVTLMIRTGEHTARSHYAGTLLYFVDVLENCHSM